VSELCGVKAACAALLGAGIHQLRPVKRRGNRRYYQHHEVLLIRRIRELLYEQGITISGARNRLDESLKRRARSRFVVGRVRRAPWTGAASTSPRSSKS